MEDVKNTVLPVKTNHRYYWVLSENLTNNYKVMHKYKETKLSLCKGLHFSPVTFDLTQNAVFFSYLKEKSYFHFL